MTEGSVYRVVELIGASSDSWEQAARNAVREAARTYQDLRVRGSGRDGRAHRGRRHHRVPYQDAAQLQALLGLSLRLPDDRSNLRAWKEIPMASTQQAHTSDEPAIHTAAGFELVPISGVLGAEVRGIDLSAVLDDAAVATIRAALVEHGVLVFRDQDLSPDRQIAFGRRFGELDTHPFVEGNADHPEIVDVITVPDDRELRRRLAHRRHLPRRTRPRLDPLRRRAPSRRWRHPVRRTSTPPTTRSAQPCSRCSTGSRRSTPPGRSTRRVDYRRCRRRCVRRTQSSRPAPSSTPSSAPTPSRGVRALYVNGAFTTRIVGLHRAESAALLDFLCDHATSERFTCRVRWEPGTLTMWDNRSVQHYALHDYAGHRRHMRRITVKGDRPR